MSNTWLIALFLLQAPQVGPSEPPASLLIGVPAGKPTIALNGTATIRGVVRRLDSNEPLRNLRVQLTTTPKPVQFSSMLGTMTDENGRFEFWNLPDDDYQVLVSAQGFFAPSRNGLQIESVKCPVCAAEMTESNRTASSISNSIRVFWYCAGCKKAKWETYYGTPQPEGEEGAMALKVRAPDYDLLALSCLFTVSTFALPITSQTFLDRL